MRSWKEVTTVLVGIVLITNVIFYIYQSNQTGGVTMSGEQEHVSKATEPMMPFLVLPTLTKTPRSRTFYTPRLTPLVSTLAFSPPKPKLRSLPIQSSTPCNVLSTGRGQDEGRWYNFTTSKMTFFAYSAFVDDRPSLQTDPVVRIIAVADIIEDMNPVPSMFCRFYYLVDSTAELISLETKESLYKSSFQKSSEAKLKTVTIDVAVEMNPIRNIGMGWFLNSKMVKEYIFTCPIPNLNQLRENGKTGDSGLKSSDLKSDHKIPLPTSVGVLNQGASHADIASCLPVEKPSKPKYKQDFVLCVQVAFDQIDPLQLIEWLELQSLLGVQSIGIYNLGVHEPAMVVLRHYAEKGLVDLRMSDYIPDGYQQYFLHGSPVINDCMFRNLHAYKFLMVYDIDEVILPRISKSDLNRGTPFKVLMDNLEKKYGKGPSQYLFRNSYFFIDIPPDTNEPKEFVFLRHKKTAPVSRYGYSTKSIIDQRSCIQMHNHYCWGSTKEYESEYRVDVDIALGKNHHYKKCHFSSDECKSMMEKATYDDTILVYRDELISRVITAINQIRLKLKKSGNSHLLSSYFTTS